MPPRRVVAFAGCVLAVVAVQVAAGAAGRSYYLTQLTMSAYYALVVLGLSLLMGYAGQISLGQAGFFAIGGYLTALMTTHDLAGMNAPALLPLAERFGLLVRRADYYGGEILHVQPIAAAVTAIVAAALVAWIIAGPVFRLRGHYLAMATLGFGIIVHRIFLGSELFGGADGITDVPSLGLFPGLEVGGKTAVRVQNYYLAWGILLATMAALLNLVESRVGRALRAVHGSENAAAAVGVPIARYKLQTFVLGAVLAAVAGVFLTHYNGSIGPSEASLVKSVRYVAIVAVGGMSRLWSTLAMAVVLNFLSLRGSFGTYDDLVFGVILIVVMLFAPDGVSSKPLTRLMRRRQTETPEEPAT